MLKKLESEGHSIVISIMLSFDGNDKTNLELESSHCFIQPTSPSMCMDLSWLMIDGELYCLH
jgi:hypothetical protein